MRASRQRSGLTISGPKPKGGDEESFVVLTYNVDKWAFGGESIAQSVRAAFTQFLKEGYAVGPKGQVQQSRPMDRVPERDRRGPPDRRTIRSGPGRRDRPGGGPGGKGPRSGGPPKGKPTK